MTTQGCHCEEQGDEAISGRLAAPVVIVHSLGNAVSTLTVAARVGCTVVLLSAPGAGSYGGPGGFGAVIAPARGGVPEPGFFALLDCGDDVGAALAAIRSEIEGVVFTGRADAATRLADISSQHRVRLIIDRPAATLDLADDVLASPEIIEQRCADLLI